MKNSTVNKRLLADVLIDVADGIRRDVHESLGTRPWIVDIITRRWSGGSRGQGTPTISILTLDPVPSVRVSGADRLGPAGREPVGSAVVTEISLRYSLEELEPKVDARTEVAWRIREKHGQRSGETFYVLNTSPIQRRGDKSGDETDWYVSLKETSPMTNIDGVNA